ncbi:hypothetical protein RchiOBHm_Chr6g0268841 [Rosa chinensis]|uniref:Uncharacterized protein n=1 Tax=Rosa chinensis TaxID=74649 RepID=A0A2P6PQD7_ROSCH|nr:hypothetical protein RchiOBHm_Chr6g0268841 [Rosa chinensis]
MLAKQAWRIVQNPDSLVSSIYKTKYFHSTSFINNSLGAALSYTWRSIITSREILEAGMRWQVDDARSIAIWEDN